MRKGRKIRKGGAYKKVHLVNSDVYQGPHPFSERETRAVKDYVGRFNGAASSHEDPRARMVATLDIHCCMGAVLPPFNFSPMAPRTEKWHQAVGKSMARAMMSVCTRGGACSADVKQDDGDDGDGDGDGDDGGDDGDDNDAEAGEPTAEDQAALNFAVGGDFNALGKSDGGDGGRDDDDDDDAPSPSLVIPPYAAYHFAERRSGEAQKGMSMARQDFADEHFHTLELRVGAQTRTDPQLLRSDLSAFVAESRAHSLSLSALRDSPTGLGLPPRQRDVFVRGRDAPGPVQGPAARARVVRAAPGQRPLEPGPREPHGRPEPAPDGAAHAGLPVDVSRSTFTH